ncbi:MAG: type 4a pilus biogenesis protein PilO [Deltaproteobacteria bacterium]|nr:type 4a pilus biogenesis protein PilO [Deltaproteobacteria bacterium]MBW2694902.1 type 4a pilus biogenesis protein PilO [Deltaproteobacteria bacterium]
MDLNFDFDEQLEKLGKIPKPIRLAVVSAVLCSVAAAYWAVSYQPRADEVTVRLANAQQLQRKLNNVRAVASNVGAFEMEVAALERDLEQALKQLPNGKQFEDLLRDISTAGKQVGVRIKSIQREPEIPRDFYAEVPFRLEVEGTYHDLARFFERVGQLARIVNVGALEVNVLEENRRNTSLRIVGTATTFRFLGEGDRRPAPTAKKKKRRSAHGQG